MRLYGEVHLSLIWIHQRQRIKMLTYFDKIGSIAIKKNDKLSHKKSPRLFRWPDIITGTQ
ncbi:Uncharacterised protein [Enterobacter hormaechei]|nr:Uncharacterised protein [Enterobacter hormaechei]